MTTARGESSRSRGQSCAACTTRIFAASSLAIFILTVGSLAIEAADEVEGLIAHGDFAAALRGLEAARDAAQQSGKCDRDVAAVLNNLGLVYSELGRPRDAQFAYEKSLALWRDLRIDNTQDAAHTLGNLGAIYMKLNLLRKSEETLVRAASLEEKLGGGIAATKVWVNLALVYKNERRWKDAENLLRKTLEIRERELGPSHRDVALALNNLAVLLEDQKRIAEAEPLLSRAVRIWEVQVGPAHPRLAAGLHNLATVDASLGRFDQAEANFKRAIEIARAELPADHPDLASYEKSYAHLLRQLGRKNEARRLEESAESAHRQHARQNLTGYTIDAQQLQH